jgi:hypothetical protein
MFKQKLIPGKRKDCFNSFSLIIARGLIVVELVVAHRILYQSTGVRRLDGWMNERQCAVIFRSLDPFIVRLSWLVPSA